MANKIFVSYRRSDSAASALAIGQFLARRFGDANVFIDVDMLAGTKFDEKLEKCLAQCSVLLCVIGPRWNESRGLAANPRISEENDWVAKELRRALARNVAIVPVLVDGASMPEEETLPSDLRAIVRYQAVALSTTSFRNDMTGLARDISELVVPKRNWRWMMPALAIGACIAVTSIVFIKSDLMQFTRVASLPSPPAKAATSRPIIVIDAGHGGHDSGAYASNIAEKDLTLDYATRIADAVRRSGHFDVLLTRSSDTFVELEERVRYAKNRQAAMFISLHVDFSENSSTRGMTIYTRRQIVTDKSTGEGSAGAKSQSVSDAFARLLAGNLQGVVSFNENRALRDAGFILLKSLPADSAATLIQLGFISNSDDRQSLVNQEKRDAVVRAFAEAIKGMGTLGFFKSREALTRSENERINEFAEIAITLNVKADAARFKKCTLATANYGDEGAVIIHAFVGQTNSYTVLGVNQGTAKKEVSAYIANHAPGGRVLDKFDTVNKAMDVSFELCPN